VRALLLVFVAVAGVACEDDAAPPATAARTVAPSTAATQRQREDCRDACEQQVIVAQAGDAVLRACRAKCDARYGAAVAPHEVPSKITRAAPVHAPPAVRPK
jgi:hypothetical protein